MTYYLLIVIVASGGAISSVTLDFPNKVTCEVAQKIVEKYEFTLHRRIDTKAVCIPTGIL